ncbi:succinate dehydrogenase [Cystoisospora suis]|uniref:Succinate dehydrogenase n=1 Tax=Cystoisospora suis TaxID=483139 RepID=A0A2C6L6Y7_9APIC|nr:succinate dehydrogenase [Cystoisospora suis]
MLRTAVAAAVPSSRHVRSSKGCSLLPRFLEPPSFVPVRGSFSTCAAASPFSPADQPSATAASAAMTRSAVAKEKEVGLKGPRIREFLVHRYNPETDKRPRMQKYELDVSTCGPMILDALIAIKDRQDPSLVFRRSCREGICGSCAMNVDGKNCLACLTPIERTHRENEAMRLMPDGLTADRHISFYAMGTSELLWVYHEGSASDDVHSGISPGLFSNTILLSLVSSDWMCSCLTTAGQDIQKDRHEEEVVSNVTDRINKTVFREHNPPVEILPLPNMMVLRDLVPDMTNFYAQYRSVEPWLKRKTVKTVSVQSSLWSSSHLSVVKNVSDTVIPT